MAAQLQAKFQYGGFTVPLNAHVTPQDVENAFATYINNPSKQNYSTLASKFHAGQGAASTLDIVLGRVTQFPPSRSPLQIHMNHTQHGGGNKYVITALSVEAMQARETTPYEICTIE